MLQKSEFKDFIRDFCNRRLQTSVSAIGDESHVGKTTVESFMTARSDTGIYNVYRILEAMGVSFGVLGRDLHNWTLENAGEPEDSVADYAGTSLLSKRIDASDLDHVTIQNLDMRARDKAIDIISAAQSRNDIDAILRERESNVDFDAQVNRYLRVYLRERSGKGKQ
ncbi:hypothetical protein SAMN02745687_02064 [Lachnospiraceae bacterium NK3A20]|nr:hypothetical protein SAMN02745687_02064 [Lachnospiraceae bacterium NK3A20]